MSERASIDRDDAADVRVALERTIHSGGVALFPADGLYGLACDPLRADAIGRIHEIKGRDEGKPSAVMYLSPLLMREVVGSMGELSRAAAASLLPGPVTLVIANPERRYPLACREDPERLGVRLIAGPLSGARVVLFQTSANRSGEPPPSGFEDVDESIVDAVDLAIDGGELTGMPSTVVDLTRIDEDGNWEVLREGALSRDDLAAALD
jgi:L-threonylcarbamoyladenylate synthase